MENMLYRAYDENENLIYIGQSTKFLERMKQHIKSSEWSGLVDTWKLQRFDTQEKLLTHEKIAIKKEKPLYNKTHNLYYRQNMEELKSENKKLTRVIKQKDRELKKYKEQRKSLVQKKAEDFVEDSEQIEKVWELYEKTDNKEEFKKFFSSILGLMYK